MKKIFKYPVTIQDEQTIMLPEGAEILTIQAQKMGVYLWALVDPENPPVERTIVCRGTGHDADGLFKRDYIDTVQVAAGNLVFHFFEPNNIQTT